MDATASVSSPDVITRRITHPRALQFIRIAWIVLAVIVIGFSGISSLTQPYALLENLTPYSDLLARWQVQPIWLATWITITDLITYAPYILMALLVFQRRSDDLLAVITSIALLTFGVTLITVVFPYDGLGQGMYILAATSMFAFAYLFPNGRFVPSWTKWLLGLDVLIFVSLSLFFEAKFAFLPNNDFGIYIIIALCFAPPFLVQVYRYRQVSNEIERKQSQWVLVGMCAVAIALFGTALLFWLFPVLREPTESRLLWWAIGYPIRGVLCALLPLSFSIALLRFRLWDMGFMLNRSTVYSVLGFGLLFFFVFDFIVLNTLFKLILREEFNIAAIGLSLVLCALAIRPVKYHVRNFVDVNLFGMRYNLEELAKAQNLKPEIKNPGALTGQQFGRYEVLGLIGRGGMGEVYKGYADGHTVALKVLPPDLAQQSEFKKRFDREAQTLSKLDHPQIVRLLAAGVSGETSYLAMEYVQGMELTKAIKESTSPDFETIREWALQICSALDYAHARGIVHRDLKPSNIMLRPCLDGEKQEAILMDFGVARIAEAHTLLTGTGAIGTLEYMAPEQIMAAREVDHRADVYAFGVILYELLTGERPFKGGPGQVVFAHLQHPPPDPREVNPNVPRSMAKAILKALSKKPEERHQSAGELAHALAEA
ncbi:MAG: serine/threonine protein kinase [Anaerolineae bacterium]|jgi:predicted Ser/Thr protein kinase|nr:serine/threonine protein kinase [Anaerolineae bacterium]